MADIENLKIPLNKSDVIPCGIKGIDDYCKLGDDLYGLPRGAVGLIGGDFGCGRTTLLTVMGRNFERQNLNVLHVTVEDRVSQIVKKYYSSKTGISLNKIAELDIDGLAEIFQEYRQDDNGIFIKSMSFWDDFEDTIKDVVEDQSIDVILFDGMVAGPERVNGLPSTKELREVALKYNVLIWGVAQTKRLTKATDDNVLKYDLGSVALVDFFAHMTRYGVDKFTERTLEIIKHRHDHKSGAPSTFKLNFDAERVQVD